MAAKYAGVRARLKPLAARTDISPISPHIDEQESPAVRALSISDLLCEIVSNWDQTHEDVFRTLVALGRSCRAVARIWRAQLHYIPTKFSPKLTNNILLRFPNLTAVDLWLNTTVTDEGLWQAAPALVHLELKGNRTITNKCLARCTALTSLDLSQTLLITGEALASLTDLRTLNLSLNTQVGGESILPLCNLTSLNLSRNKLVSGEVLERLPSLRHLNLSYGSAVTDYAFRRLTQVERMDLNGNSDISDSAVVALIHTLRDFTGRGWLT